MERPAFRRKFVAGTRCRHTEGSLANPATCTRLTITVHRRARSAWSRSIYTISQFITVIIIIIVVVVVVVVVVVTARTTKLNIWCITKVSTAAAITCLYRWAKKPDHF